MIQIDPLAVHQQLYTLQHNKPVRCVNPFEWLDWMNATPLPEERTVLNSRRILKTTFLCYAGDRRESQPLTFATVFNPEPALPDFAIVLEWYYSWDEAKAGHARYMQRFNQQPIKSTLRNGTGKAPSPR